MYVSVRGWLEIDRGQRDEVRGVIENHRGRTCAERWIFPESTGSGYCIFYGASLREGCEVELRALIAEVARLPRLDAFFDDRPAGQFLLSDERQQSWMWVVHKGAIHDVSPPTALHEMMIRQ
ncbi:hypothetical protein WEH80_26850 [Actinomycetes bacterium KLBMP 9759]